MSLHPQPFTVVPPETARVARRIPPGQPEVGGATERYAELGIMLHALPANWNVKFRQRIECLANIHFC
jgi:hypothetical protein